MKKAGYRVKYTKEGRVVHKDLLGDDLIIQDVKDFISREILTEADKQKIIKIERIYKKI